MNRPTAAHLAWARSLLALEHLAGDPDGPATAQRVLEKLRQQLEPLLGVAGVQALLVRSARLAEREFECLANRELFSRPAGLRDCLRLQAPEPATAAAETLFGTFSALISRFIGDRLTTEVLRNAWPAIEDIPPKESD